MRRWLAVTLVSLASIVAAGLGVFFFLAPAWLEGALNPVVSPPPYQASAEARALHDTLIVADLHADPLLWGRDLIERGTRGHVDIPRLAEGNIAIEVFSVVTQSPRGMNIERNDASTDNILPLGIAQRWPVRTWGSLMQRALYQAARLEDVARRSDGRFVLIRTRRDLAVFLKRRVQEPDIVAGVLAIEGAHALEGDPANAEILFAAGYRMMSFAHFFDSEMGGSAHGMERYGLTEKGRDLLGRMERLGMIVDLSHASARQIDDVLALSTKPLVVSHGGVKGTCDNNRNLSDDQVRAVADRGGLIGIGFWDTAICGEDASAIAAAIQYTAALVGPDHVGLGSDFDGSVRVPFDATGIVQVTDALLARGMPPSEIGMIMGANQVKLLLETLPDA